jgi:site-specific recombinase XerD
MNTKRHTLRETLTLSVPVSDQVEKAAARSTLGVPVQNVAVENATDIPPGAAALLQDLLPVVRQHNPNPATFRYVVKRVRESCQLQTPVRPRHLPRYLSPAEIYAVTETARASFSVRHLVLLHLLFSTGLRISEAQKLDVRDVDFFQHQIMVREGKGKKDRIVLITPKVLDQLRLYLDGEGLKVGPLFPSQKQPGRSVTARQLQRMYADVCAAAGLGRLHPHTARHTFAMLCRARGMALQDIQALLGHSSIKTTEIYARIAHTPELRERYLQLFP